MYTMKVCIPLYNLGFNPEAYCWHTIAEINEKKLKGLSFHKSTFISEYFLIYLFISNFCSFVSYHVDVAT